MFLLGMVVMTDGLRALAGDALRAALMRFTRSPLSGAITGATSTAILQSSSATTVATVGFVGAGLMSFPEALGVIFGANIGTTVTGWLVALLGLKLQLATAVLPLILIGAILRLFARGRISASGYAMAGFGLIFVGITMMQQGMSGLHDVINPDLLPADSIAGRLKLLGMGLIFTLITQSSSAGVAATLTALYAGSVNFPQAAALVIGMDIGTTITALIATVGGSVGARRTGFSHLAYNLYSSLCALILLTPYIFFWESVVPGGLREDPELALVAFHTGYNILAAIVILPFTYRFAHIVVKLIPQKTPLYTDKLDRPLLQQPSMALNAVQSTIPTEVIALLKHVNAILGEKSKGKRTNLRELDNALYETHSYIDRIHLSAGAGTDWKRLVELIHTLDHIQRLHERCEEEEDRATTARTTVELTKERELLTSTVGEIIEYIEQQRWIDAKNRAEQSANIIHEHVTPYRDAVMAQIAGGKLDVLHGTERLEAVRWLRRVSKHIARIMQHYFAATTVAGD